MNALPFLALLSTTGTDKQRKLAESMLPAVVPLPPGSRVAMAALTADQQVREAERQVAQTRAAEDRAKLAEQRVGEVSAQAARAFKDAAKLTNGLSEDQLKKLEDSNTWLKEVLAGDPELRARVVRAAEPRPSQGNTERQAARTGSTEEQAPVSEPRAGEVPEQTAQNTLTEPPPSPRDAEPPLVVHSNELKISVVDLDKLINVFSDAVKVLKDIAIHQEIARDELMEMPNAQRAQLDGHAAATSSDLTRGEQPPLTEVNSGRDTTTAATGGDTGRTGTAAPTASIAVGKVVPESKAKSKSTTG